MDYAYCSIDEAREGPGETGNASAWLSIVKDATQLIELHLGSFLPYKETRRFDGPGGKVLYVDGLLSSAPTIVNDTTTLVATDYLLYPRQRRWRNGPYTRIEIDPDAASLTAWDTERDNVTVAGDWGWYDEDEAISGATVQNTTSQDATTTTLTVQTGLVQAGMVLLIESELEFVTAVTVGATDTCTVVRGVLGTTAAIHLNGVAVRRQIVPPVIHRISKAIAATLWKGAKSGYVGKTIVPELGQINIHEIVPKELMKLARTQFHPVASV